MTRPATNQAADRIVSQMMENEGKYKQNMKKGIGFGKVEF
jgi:hypothetical protein